MDIQQIIKIAHKAGEMFSERNFVVEQKSSVSDKVTSMDIKIEEFLKRELTGLVEGSGFMGEESQSSALENEYVWVVDPIDGTSNFVRDLSASCISIALLKNKQAYMGVVYNPYKDEMFYAQKGGVAFLNGKKISVSGMPFESSLLFTSYALYDKHLANICFDIAREAYQSCDDIRRFGSAAIELCLLACGRGDLYFEIRLSPWDYAAGVLILQEAGGHAAVFGSEKITYDVRVPVIAANSTDNFQKLYAIVKKHMK